MRIESFFSSPELDGRGAGIAASLAQALGRAARVDTIDVILCDSDIPGPIARELFIDPVAQCLAEKSAPALERFAGWTWLAEISYKPGVTDTLALTARQALAIAAQSGLFPDSLPTHAHEPVSAASMASHSRGKAQDLRGIAKREDGNLTEDACRVCHHPANALDLDAMELQTARLFLMFVSGASRADIESACKTMWNPLIQNALFLSYEDWQGGARLPSLYPRVSLHEKPEPELIDIAAMDDAGLEELSSRRLFALNLVEMSAIRSHYRDPAVLEARRAQGLSDRATDVELEMIAQTWSEHCKHKIFNATIEYRGPDGKVKTIDSLFKTFIRSTTEDLASARPDLLSVFTDNAGVFKFDDDTAVCVKVETHNSPSALDPYGGAITGIVGVNRDILGTGLGAAPLFNTDVLCFAPPSTPPGIVPEGLMHPADIMRGVHRGIVDGGNQSGIPVVAGAFVFDPSYLGKPLVFCGTGGIMPLDICGKPSWEKSVEAGMLAVMVGGRIGKDGIHGATFSSLALDETSPSSAVQIGDPIIQKRMGDFLLEARDLGLYCGITDNGAGGLSSSLGEMAESSGGVRIDLAACPLKYQGLAPWEILVSESQERMSLAVQPRHIDELLALARRRGVELSVVGEFTDSGRVAIHHGPKPVGLLSLDFLHRGLPVMRLKAEWDAPSTPRADLPARAEGRELFFAVLSDPDVASKEELVRYYDHEVKALSIEKPCTGIGRDAPSDGAVLKPLYSSWRGLTVTHGIAPRLSAHDARLMALAAVDEAYRAHIALGGDPRRAVALDNFCWPDPVKSDSNPDGAFKLGQLVRACEALREACLVYGLPLVSGKDSMKNDARAGGKKISVQPTLLVTLTGLIDDVRKAMSTDFLAAGELVYLVGQTRGELGASILERVLGLVGSSGLGPCPEVRPSEQLPIYRALHRSISGRLIRSCHDLSDGGLAVAVAESCLGGRLGVELRLDGLADKLVRKDSAALRLLFAEDPGRFLVSIRPEDRERFERSMPESSAVLIGETTSRDRIVVSLDGSRILDCELGEVRRAFMKPILPGRPA